MADLVSRPYAPDPERCCQACVFGRGEHAEWCAARKMEPAVEWVERLVAGLAESD
jgi:hypothetical protein